MFVDEVRIQVQAGRGGNGAVTFRREKHVPRGGPNGGDGGTGGDVVAVVDPSLRTLIDFQYRHHFRAEDGGPGGKNNCHGANGEDSVLPLPPGTLVYEEEGNQLRADLVAPGTRFVLAQGGPGGRGNAAFATATRQTPRFGEQGAPGEEKTLRLELKLLADAALIGLPNVGKSTLIARVSAARPKIADYPFTTLVPNLGVVRWEEGKSFVLADLPGLIAGAHAGRGLGDRFLRHVERARVLVHLLDLSDLERADPVGDLEAIRTELAAYNPRLATLPEIVVANKLDQPHARERWGACRAELEVRAEGPVWGISAVTGEGLRPLLQAVASAVETAGPSPVAEAITPLSGSAAPSPNYEISHPEPGLFILQGADVERLVAMTDVDNPEALGHLHRQLSHRGVLRSLRQAGVQEGDLVRVGEIEFDFVE